jgi:hypothetical protein
MRSRRGASLAGWILAAALLATPATPRADAQLELSAPERATEAADIFETRWSAERPPGGKHDRIQVHRYRTRSPSSIALLYLPGTHMNGELALRDDAHDLWIFLARRGVHVYTLDYRSHFVPPSATRLEFMRGWGLAAFTADAEAAAALARRESPGAKLFVAGFSRGVTLAYALAMREPAPPLAGLIALDGGFKRAGPPGTFDAAAALRELESSQRFALDVAEGIGWERRAELMRRTVLDPREAPLDLAFANVGDQLGRLLQDAWGPGALSNPLGGASRVEVLARLLGGYDRYYPAVQNIEGRALAQQDDDPTSPLDDAWGESTLPIFYVGSTGMGARALRDGIHSAVESGSKDVQVRVLEEHGHLDVLVGEASREQVFEPLLDWIRAH